MKEIFIGSILFGIFTLPPSLSYSEGRHERVVVEGGVIKDEKVAVEVAFAILKSVYGEAQIRKQRPLSVELVDGIWIVSGTLKAGRKGGVAEIHISKTTGEVIEITHGE